LAEPLRRASYLSTVSQPRSSVLVEIGWLAYFVVVFVVAVYVLVGLLVPHHFNDKIAIALAAIFAGLIMIATRAWMTARVRPR
jgi:lipopolysaccharide export LptBFGC system permease protein LptF